MDLFGSSVALDGDVLVVGAPEADGAARGIDGDQTDNSAKDSGAEYIFSGITDRWAQRAYLKASNAAAGEVFGTAVAISGTTIVVGAAGQSSSAKGINPVAGDNAAIGSGAVYVFERSGSTYRETAFVKASKRTRTTGLVDRSFSTRTRLR